MTTQADRSQMTTSELDERLHAHFIKPEDQLAPLGAGAVYLTEVTAPGGTRRADAVHIGLWHSRGAGRIDACELKVSRSDWLRELEKPEKAEAWWPYCNNFWLVVPTADIVKDGELPDGWGLMVPQARGRRFKTLVSPAERAADELKLTHSLLVTLLKNTQTTRGNALRTQRNDLQRHFQTQLQEVRRERGAGLSRADKERLELLDALEKELGMKLTDWAYRRDQLSPAAAAEGLRAYLEGPAALAAMREDGKHRVRDADRALRSMQEDLDVLRKTLAE